MNKITKSVGKGRDKKTFEQVREETRHCAVTMIMGMGWSIKTIPFSGRLNGGKSAIQAARLDLISYWSVAQSQHLMTMHTQQGCRVSTEIEPKSDNLCVVPICSKITQKCKN